MQVVRTLYARVHGGIDPSKPSAKVRQLTFVNGIFVSTSASKIQADDLILYVLYGIATASLYSVKQPNDRVINDCYREASEQGFDWISLHDVDEVGGTVGSCNACVFGVKRTLATL